MTADPQWMSLKEAVDFGAEHEVLLKHAQVKILQALQDERIRSRAGRITRKTSIGKWEQTDWPLHGEYWRLADADGSYLSVYESILTYVIDTPGLEPPHHREVWHGKDIQLFRKHVEGLWPSADRSQTEIIKTRGKGGRTMKYDWPAAAGFIAAHVIDNDYPVNKSDLVRLLEDWFSNKGSAPDVREMERFVSEVYQRRPGK